jgi:hypothetical protein
MNETSTKVILTLFAAALLVVGWLSMVSMEQQQAHASACNLHVGGGGKTTGNLAAGPPGACFAARPGTHNIHIHLAK